jgi:prophage regulatory protein
MKTEQSLPHPLSTRAVMALTSFSRGTLYLKSRDGTFPKPLKISERRIAYRAADVQAWLETRPQVQ